MTSYSPARTTTGRIRIRWVRVLALLAAVVAIAAALGAPGEADGPPVLRSGHHHGRLGLAGGAVPDGTTAFADDVPGVARLDRELLGALRRAADDAGRSGVQLLVDSGWRSRAYQAHLLRQAIDKYGSEAEARRWVATPKRSAHVKGEAVDIGPSAAAGWLAEHGSAYGLCRIYGNEPWHFELRADAIGRGCPPTYADPTHDPRMQS